MKQFISFSIASIILCLTTAQAPKPQKQRILTVTLTENTWIVLLNVLDKSDMPHLTVRALQDSLYKQLNDTLKNPILK